MKQKFWRGVKGLIRTPLALRVGRAYHFFGDYMTTFKLPEGRGQEVDLENLKAQIDGKTFVKTIFTPDTDSLTD